MVTKLKNEDKLPAIFFVFSKRGSGAILHHLTKFGDRLNTPEEQKEILDIIKSYKQNGKYLGESLDEKALLKGNCDRNPIRRNKYACKNNSNFIGSYPVR